MLAKRSQTFKLSPSSLNLFRECPRCFWLAQHKVWTRPSGPFPSLPAGMDKILKAHFDKFMKQGKMPPELCERQECALLKLFDNDEKLKLWQNNFKGISLKDSEGNELHGAVDNILVRLSQARSGSSESQTKGKKLIVLDYKTRGYAIKEDTAEHYRFQLNVYNYLLRKNGYETEDYSFLLFYVPKEVMPTGEVIFDTELVKMKVDIDEAEKVWKKALDLLDGDCPKKSCVWCERV